MEETNRILVIDDEEVMRSLLSDLLTERGFAVDTVRSGEEGVARFKAGSYEVVITDIRMPGMDGIMTLRRLREHNRDAVVIVITGYGALETAQEALRLGAYDYITKPFETDEIIHVIKRAIAHAKLILANRELLLALEGEREILEKLIEERSSRLRLLADVGKILLQTPEPDKLIPKIAEKIASVMDLEICSILLIDEATQELVIRGAVGLSSEIVQSTRLPIGTGVSGWVVLHNEPLWVEDIEKDERFARKSRERYYTHSLLSVPVPSGTGTIGAINVNNKKSHAPFAREDLALLTEIAAETGVAIDNAKLIRGVQETYVRVINALISAVDVKDKYTRSHSESVGQHAVVIGEAMGLARSDLQKIELAGKLHDVGKIAIHDRVLLKRGPLSEEEFDEIKTHSVIGMELLAPLPFLKEVAVMVGQNHEHWDGSGYPDGLKGDRISFGARLVAVADAYDSMITERPYRKPWPKDQVIRELERCAGTQFDPKIVEATVRLIRAGEI